MPVNLPIAPGCHTIGIRPLISFITLSVLLSGCKEKDDLPIVPIDLLAHIPFNPSITYGSMTDQDGNIYKTVTIGTRIWMAENLKTTKYNDETSIPLVTDKTAWSNLITPGYCWYNNEKDTYSKIYGALYNWSAVNTGKLCPTGWHVPTDAEWTTLETYLIINGFNYDGTTTDNVIAKSMASTVLWARSLNPGAVGNTDYPAKRNATGFTALPGGLRSYRGNYIFAGTYSNLYNEYMGSWGCWWSATEAFDAYAWGMMIQPENSYSQFYSPLKSQGTSVRCIKD